VSPRGARGGASAAAMALALWAAAPDAARAASHRGGAFTVDCTAPAREISPHVYGIAALADGAEHFWRMRPTARRWGGNASSRFNWELGDAWSTNHDWFFQNVRVSTRPGYGWEAFLDENHARGIPTALTVPMLGWVAKDTTSHSFPISRLGPQRGAAPDRADAGDGIGLDGRPLRSDPAWTSVRSSPENVERWVRRIRARDGPARRSVHLYVLDNEPMLWHSTHRDVHPEPLGYDELLERTVAYASAVRRADPQARIAGPALWGWLAWHYSAKDVVAGLRLRPDRRRHGDVPLLPWWLREMREHEERTGVRLVDVLDVHFYPANPAIGAGTAGGTDRAAAALRIRSTRSLWDPGYVDESWIGERMQVLPRLRAWVQEHHPRLGISIGEWNFGAEGHMSGGLAVVEALGRFGTEGLSSAYYWNVPPDGSPAFWAFRAYRDFDGRGGAFLELSVPVSFRADAASLFASRDPGGERIVAVLLNLDPDSALSARVDLSRCGAVAVARGFTYAGGQPGLVPLAVDTRGGGVVAAVAPYSITVLDVRLAARGPHGGEEGR
jgi:hypothetical protein